ncbi:MULTISPECIES: porin [unclassified Bradyrhizobium]|uniref:porin n=1 Tax=unclassified Bradyrhizobium TaxID=2631580 RepID=UPI0029165743|nr:MULTISPECIES: porin [unclassified Bradyrhizobium]
MKTVKSLILGSAAALVAMGGAQAADLPIKAKAVEYVKVCSLYGAGFYYIPGTDTCIKLGGYLRVETAIASNSVYNNAVNGAAGAQNRLSNYYTARSREDLNIDTRTATEYGVVRTFFDATFSWTTGTYSSTGTGATAYPAAGTPNNDGVAGGTLGVYYAFIQFAGFTMGKAVSQFDAPWTNYPGNNFDGLTGGGGTVTGINQFSYTADFGQGITASFSAQDSTAYQTTNVWNTAVPFTAANVMSGVYGGSAIGGTRSPDLVAALRVDQAWGLFQASFAAHDNHAAYYGATEPTGHPSDKWGWAASLALSIKNIPTGPGDTINLQATYTDAATRYNFQSLVPTAFAMFGGTNLAGAYQSIGFASVADTVYGPGTSQQSVTTWGFRGGYTHNWNAYWNTAIYGSYAQLRYGGTGVDLVCAGIRPFLTAGSTCNPNFNLGTVGLITRWTPVKNLTFSADLAATFLDQKYSGAIVNAAGVAAVAKPGATYELKDQSSVSLLLRAQRNW